MTLDSQRWNIKAPCIQKTQVMQDSLTFKLDEWARPSKLIQNFGMLYMLLMAVEPFSVNSKFDSKQPEQDEDWNH